MYPVERGMKKKRLSHGFLNAKGTHGPDDLVRRGVVTRGRNLSVEGS